MSEPQFDPTNDLENELVEVMQGNTELPEFLGKLMEVDVYIPSASEIQQDGTGFQPLMFERDEEAYMGVFSAAERGNQYSDDAPYCLSMKGKQLIQFVPNDIGLVMNPGYDVGFEIPARGIEGVKRDFT